MILSGVMTASFLPVPTFTTTLLSWTCLTFYIVLMDSAFVNVKCFELLPGLVLYKHFFVCFVIISWSQVGSGEKITQKHLLTVVETCLE